MALLLVCEDWSGRQVVQREVGDIAYSDRSRQMIDERVIVQSEHQYNTGQL